MIDQFTIDAIIMGSVSPSATTLRVHWFIDDFWYNSSSGAFHNHYDLVGPGRRPHPDFYNERKH